MKLDAILKPFLMMMFFVVTHWIYVVGWVVMPQVSVYKQKIEAQEGAIRRANDVTEDKLALYKSIQLKWDGLFGYAGQLDQKSLAERIVVPQSDGRTPIVTSATPVSDRGEYVGLIEVCFNDRLGYELSFRNGGRIVEALERIERPSNVDFDRFSITVEKFNVNAVIMDLCTYVPGEVFET